MQIPLYIIKAAYTHYKRIVENVKADPLDTRTTDALRLSRQDLLRLEKYIEQNERKTV